MTDLSSADFLKLSLQECADLLLDQLDKNEHDYSACKCYGCCDGRMFELELCMREVTE
jgi:hypothetical protein